MGNYTLASQYWSNLRSLFKDPPKPIFTLRWDDESRTWCSAFAPLAELPGGIREVFERTGYGCLAAETNIGVIHVCHAADGSTSYRLNSDAIEDLVLLLHHRLREP
jgi:hypothetical protein